MTLILRDDALKIIGPVNRAHLRDAHLEAWDIYQSVIHPTAPLAGIVGKASWMHELIIERVRQHAPDMQSVKVRENVCGGRFLLEIGNQLIIYFKKLTTDFHTTNNPTDNSDAFDSQGEIDGFPAWPRINAGYAFNELGTTIDGPYLAFMLGSKNCNWYHDLRGGEGTGILPFPTPDKGKPDEGERDVPDTPDIDLGGGD